MRFVLVVLVYLLFSFTPPIFAEQTIVEKDSNEDGKIDEWSTYNKNGSLISQAIDKHVDGKPDYWKHFREGKVFKREWDRNFDTKIDFRIIEENGRLLEKQYDDNFDGKFEKTVKPPRKGELIKSPKRA